MSAGDPRCEPWLLLRRQGGLWGVCRRALDEIVRAPRSAAGSRGPYEPPRVTLSGGGELLADEILTIVSELPVHPVPRAAKPYLGAKYRGLAIWRDEPVILLDPAAPPPACLDPETPAEEPDGDV